MASEPRKDSQGPRSDRSGDRTRPRIFPLRRPSVVRDVDNGYGKSWGLRDAPRPESGSSSPSATKRSKPGKEINGLRCLAVLSLQGDPDEPTRLGTI
jgi:hypothetical protein